MKFNPEALRNARDKAGLSRRELAEKSGVSQTTIHYAESGRTPDPRLSKLEQIARALGVNSAVFFAQTNRKNDKHPA